LATRTIYLVRHGQYQHMQPMRGLPFLPSERRDLGLTPVGIRQAILTAERLAELPVTAIYASTMPRAAQTAALIGHQLPHIPLRSTRFLWECVPGLPAAPFARRYRRYPPEILADGLARAERAFQRFFITARKTDKNAVLISHANLIRYFVCRVMDAPPDRWAALEMAPGAITTIAIQSNGAMRLVAHNDAGHLAVNGVSNGAEG
jgi:serine/threonine-protein phosphatase PGAM5